MLRKKGEKEIDMSRWIRCIATGLLLTLGFGVPAQAKPPAASAASHRQGGILEELTAYGVALFLTLKYDGERCGTAYCPTPPGPPPPGHTMSLIAKPAPAGKG
jgi:hypothetical protein